MPNLIRSTVRMSFLWNCEGKENCANFSVPPQTAKIMSTVHDKCLG